MFSIGRIFWRSLKNYQQNSRLEQSRNFNDDKSKIMLLGGGLEKLQGSMKEEEYFSALNYGLFTKLRNSMDTVTVKVVKNFEEYERVLNAAGLQDSCCMNKHKNCHEEAFFLTESSDSFKLFNNRLKKEQAKSLESSDDDSKVAVSNEN